MLYVYIYYFLLYLYYYLWWIKLCVCVFQNNLLHNKVHHLLFECLSRCEYSIRLLAQSVARLIVRAPIRLHDDRILVCLLSEQIIWSVAQCSSADTHHSIPPALAADGSWRKPSSIGIVKCPNSRRSIYSRVSLHWWCTAANRQFSVYDDVNGGICLR